MVTALSDDLTGAAAVASELHGAGLSVRVVVAGSPADGTADALVVDTGTRCGDRERAAAEVARALRARPGDGWFKRIDSGLRGNVASELHAMSAELGRPLMVAAAAPSLGVTTVGGVQLAGGVPIADTHYADGPDRPTGSSLADLLPGCALVGLDDVRGPGLAGEIAGLAAAGRHAVCDGETEEDLARVGVVLADLGETVVPVGSYGLARHWARRPAEGGAPVVIAVSSLKPASLRQARIAALRGAHIAWGDAAGVRAALTHGRDAILMSAPEGARPDALSHTAADELAERVHGLATAVPLAGLVLVGGELASAFLRLAGAGADVLASPWPATAAVALTGGPLDGRVAILKSGSTGDPGWIDQAAGLVRCLSRTREERHAG